MYDTRRVNVPLVLAGCLALVGAAIHGVAGEILVVRRLVPDLLPSTRFGGPRTTRSMIHVTWHMTTIAFLTVGCALLVAGTVLDGDAAQAVAVIAAVAYTGFGALAVGLGAARTRSPGALLRHPGPLVLSATAALAWVGAL